MSYISAKEISVGYGRQDILEHVSFELDSGSLLGIIGANGSGKTTLLKALCGILPHKGCIRVECRALEALSPRQLAQLVSYIPQRSGISIDIPVLDVVLMGFNPQLGLLQHPSKDMKAAATDALHRVGLSGKEHENYLHLSEGQKQLCILARTLVSRSKLLLLDEPESALDFQFRHRMLSLLRNWMTEAKSSAIVTLHDPQLALNFCDRLLLLSDGGVLGILDPKADPLDKMEQMLGVIYGPISLQRCRNRSGEMQIVILREDTL